MAGVVLGSKGNAEINPDLMVFPVGGTVGADLQNPLDHTDICCRRDLCRC